MKDDTEVSGLFRKKRSVAQCHLSERVEGDISAKSVEAKVVR